MLKTAVRRYVSSFSGPKSCRPTFALTIFGSGPSNSFCICDYDSHSLIPPPITLRPNHPAEYLGSAPAHCSAKLGSGRVVSVLAHLHYRCKLNIKPKRRGKYST